MSSFTHLHVTTAFSAHRGTRSPEELVFAAAQAGANAAAITDRDGLYGAVRHIRACIQSGIHPIVGADLQIIDGAGSLSQVTAVAHGANAGAGWAGLCRLISAAHSPARGKTRRLSHGSANRIAVLTRDRPASFLLDEDGSPVGTLLLGPDSDVGQAVHTGNLGQAHMLLTDWKSRLPGGVAVEIVWHLTRPGLARTVSQAARMLELAEALDVPAVLTNDVRYLLPDDAIAGDVLDAAGQLLPLDAFSPQPNAQAWLKPPGKMRAIAQAVVEASTLRASSVDQLLRVTEELAARCWLDPDSDVQWRKPKVPELGVLGITGDPATALWQKCFAGITERYPYATGRRLERVHDRLRMEMGIVQGFGFETYFLTVADVSTLMRRMNVRNQARGSGAGSLMNYLLWVSIVEPLEQDLLFERFLGNARSTLPDIDIDVESARRHEVYRAIFDRYGDHRVTLLSMQNRYRARGAVRDAGLALGLEPGKIDWIAKNIWRFEARDLSEVLSEKPELREVADLIEHDEQLGLLVNLTERLDRLPRHISMHPCGVILGDSNLMSTTPVQSSGMGLLMSQYDKDDIDDMGLLKLDILGVRMQSAIAHTLTEIGRVHGDRAAAAGGLPVDTPYIKRDGSVQLEQVPHDDEATFQNVRTTHTLGMFQIESPGQRELVGKMQPDRYSDLVADISLFRPGPMKGNMIAPFLDTKHGFTTPDYLHPLFRPFLQDSYGVVIYHEHVLRILHTCMGVSLAEADELRRAMEKQMPAIEAAFRNRTARNLDDAGQRRFTDTDIDRIWRILKAFGSYGFCKAHAASFAQTTYESAWLKTHYPAEFLCGILQHDPGMYPKRLLLGEARRMGIPILPLDVNLSGAHYLVKRVVSVTDPVAATPIGSLGIRLALIDVHGINAAEIARIVAQQPFESVDDFYTRASPSRPLIRRLAAVGALDSLTLIDGQSATRGDIIAYVRTLTARTSKPRVQDLGNQLEFRVDDRGQVAAGHPELSPNQRIAAEVSVLGMEVSGHLIDGYRPMLDELGITNAADLLSLPGRSDVLVAGIRVATQTPPMKSGKRVVFISVDDGTGCADVTFFEEAQQQTGPLLFGTRLLVIHGRTRRTGARGVSIEAERAWDMRQLWADWSTRQKRAAR